MLHLLGSSSMAFQIPPSCSVVAIFFLRREHLKLIHHCTLYFLPQTQKSKLLQILIIFYFSLTFTCWVCFISNKLLSKDYIMMIKIVLALIHTVTGKIKRQCTKLLHLFQTSVEGNQCRPPLPTHFPALHRWGLHSLKGMKTLILLLYPLCVLPSICV